MSSIDFQIQVTNYFNDIINDYILGKMVEYISLEKQKQTNIQNLITYYNFVLILKSSLVYNNINEEHNHNHNNQEIEKIDFESLRNFLKFMKKDIIFNIKNTTYNNLTNLSKLFLIKIETILKYLIKIKINSVNISEKNNIHLMYNMFIMIFYILIKNPI